MTSKINWLICRPFYLCGISSAFRIGQLDTHWFFYCFNNDWAFLKFR